MNWITSNRGKVLSSAAVIVAFSIPFYLLSVNDEKNVYYTHAAIFLQLMILLSAHPFSVFFLWHEPRDWMRRWLMGLALVWILTIEVFVFAPPTMIGTHGNADLALLSPGIILLGITPLFLVIALGYLIIKNWKGR